jgi:hypothetical protein
MEFLYRYKSWKGSTDQKSECSIEFKTAMLQGGVRKIFTPTCTFSYAMQYAFRYGLRWTSEKLQWMTRTNRNEKCRTFHPIAHE